MAGKQVEVIRRVPKTFVHKSCVQSQLEFRDGLLVLPNVDQKLRRSPSGGPTWQAVSLVEAFKIANQVAESSLKAADGSLVSQVCQLTGGTVMSGFTVTATLRAGALGRKPCGTVRLRGGVNVVKRLVRLMRARWTRRMIEHTALF
jgi:hypothetical protein